MLPRRADRRTPQLPWEALELAQRGFECFFVLLFVCFFVSSLFCVLCSVGMTTRNLSHFTLPRTRVVFSTHDLKIATENGAQDTECFPHGSGAWMGRRLDELRSERRKTQD